MNGFEKQIAISMSGLMKYGLAEEDAWELIECSNDCKGLDKGRMLVYLHSILNGHDIASLHSADLPEDLFVI